MLTADKLVVTHWYYKDEDGLLFFQDADQKALCVPHLLVMETLQEHHKSAWETTHAGATHLYHFLAY